MFRDHVETKFHSFPYMNTKMLLVTLRYVTLRLNTHIQIRPFYFEIAQDTRQENNYNKPHTLGTYSPTPTFSIFQSERELF